MIGWSYCPICLPIDVTLKHNAFLRGWAQVYCLLWAPHPLKLKSFLSPSLDTKMIIRLRCLQQLTPRKKTPKIRWGSHAAGKSSLAASVFYLYFQGKRRRRGQIWLFDPQGKCFWRQIQSVHTRLKETQIGMDLVVACALHSYIK